MSICCVWYDVHVCVDAHACAPKFGGQKRTWVSSSMPGSFIPLIQSVTEPETLCFD